MKKIILPFISISMLLLAGCIPGKVLTIETLDPAEVSFPDSTQQAMVFNFAYLPSADTSRLNEVRLLDPTEQYFVDTIVIRNIFNGLFSVLDNSPAAFLNNAPYYEVRPEDTTAFLEPLGNDAVVQLCDSFNVDAIIALEYYGLALDTKTYNTVVYDESYDYVTAADQAMVRMMMWRIYSRNEGLISEKMMRDTLFWSAYGYDEKAALDNLPDVGDVLREAFWYGGYKYGTEISPTWTEVRRTYFELNNHAGDSISLNEERLLQIASGKKKIKAYKAAYNLALYSEMNDSIGDAVKWIDRAVQLRPDAEFAKYYKSILEKRQTSLTELEKQIEP